MLVKVNLYGSLRRFTPDGSGRAELDLPEGTTVPEALARLGIGDETEPLAALVNGRSAPSGVTLKARDTLEVFPVLGGGSRVGLRPQWGRAARRSRNRPERTGAS